MEEIFSKLTERGYKGSITSATHLSDLQSEIEGRHGSGSIDEHVFENSMSHFRFELPETVPDARSIIVVAVPQPQFGVTFTRQGKKYPLVIPPTYLYYSMREVRELLTGILGPQGYKVAPGVIPYKLLAVRSGLGDYGRNNICYVPGMGSFHQLMAFCSDLPCEEDGWREAQVMEDCENCEACLQSCPSEAIPRDRFLLHAERCITFHNEAEEPFPDWIDPSWHNALVGCLHCQKACPVNKPFIEWKEEKAEFSEEETDLLLRGEPRDRLPPPLLEKLEAIEFVEALDILPRNLGVLLNREEGK